MNKLFYGYLLLLFWAPLPLGSNRPWSEMLLAALVFLLLTSWSFSQLHTPRKFTRSVRCSLTALGCLLLAQLFTSYQFFTQQTLDLGGTQLALLSGLAYCGLFFLTLQLVNSQQRIRLLICTLVFSGVCQALYGSVMVLTGIEYTFFIAKDSYLGVATGTYINRNHLAGYLELCLSAGLGLLVSQLSNYAAHNKREVLRRLVKALISQKILLRICLVIMVIALVLTHSRMGNTAFFTSMTIGGLLLLLSKRTHNRKTLFALLLSLVVIDIVVVGAYFGVDKLVDRLENTSALRETRDEVNSYTLKLVEQNLLTGTGAGSFYTAFPAVRDQDVGPLFYNHAHNDYLEFLSEARHNWHSPTGCIYFNDSGSSPKSPLHSP